MSSPCFLHSPALELPSLGHSPTYYPSVSWEV